MRFGPAEQEEQLKAKLANLTSPELEDLVDLVSISQPVVLNPIQLMNMESQSPD